MSTISALVIVSIVSSVLSQYFNVIEFDELIPNRLINFGTSNERNYQSQSNDRRINVQNNRFPSSPCPDLFQYNKLNNEIQGLLTVQTEVQDKIHMNFTLSVAVEIFTVSFKIILRSKSQKLIRIFHRFFCQ